MADDVVTEIFARLIIKILSNRWRTISNVRPSWLCNKAKRSPSRRSLDLLEGIKWSLRGSLTTPTSGRFYGWKLNLVVLSQLEDFFNSLILWYYRNKLTPYNVPYHKDNKATLVRRNRLSLVFSPKHHFQNSNSQNEYPICFYDHYTSHNQNAPYTIPF